jgi:hypothetical protein
MNPTTLFVFAVVVLAAVISRWLLRRYPTVSKRQLFVASAALVGGFMVASNPKSSAFWIHTGSTVMAVMATFLFMLLLRRWEQSGTTTGTR